jgi:hypothetical protein
MATEKARPGPRDGEDDGISIPWFSWPYTLRLQINLDPRSRLETAILTVPPSTAVDSLLHLSPPRTGKKGRGSKQDWEAKDKTGWSCGQQTSCYDPLGLAAGCNRGWWEIFQRSAFTGWHDCGNGLLSHTHLPIFHFVGGHFPYCHGVEPLPSSLPFPPPKALVPSQVVVSVLPPSHPYLCVH